MFVVMKATVNLKHLADQVKAKRAVEERITLEALGVKLKVSRATLSRIENKKMTDLLTYVKVCKWLGITMETFINYK